LLYYLSTTENSRIIFSKAVWAASSQLRARILYHPRRAGVRCASSPSPFPPLSKLFHCVSALTFAASPPSAEPPTSPRTPPRSSPAAGSPTTSRPPITKPPTSPRTSGPSERCTKACITRAGAGFQMFRRRRIILRSCGVRRSFVLPSFFAREC
jgi:hypothetical protein